MPCPDRHRPRHARRLGCEPCPAARQRPILVVDDDPKIVRLVRTYLERDGHRVTEAADGDAALGRDAPAATGAGGAGPDDPGHRRAGHHPAHARGTATGPPILVLSARGLTSDRIAGLEAGADDYLPKPFSPAELVLRVRRLLERSGDGPGAAAARPPLTPGRPGRGPRPLRGARRRVGRWP